MKRFLALVLAMILVASMLAGCAAKAPAGETKADKNSAPADTAKKQIGVVFTSLNNPVFAFMKEKMEAKIKELGYEPVILDSQEKAEVEMQNVENLISKKVAGICLLAVNSDAALKTIKKANDAGIPIVGWNRFVDTKGQCEYVTQVVTDNVPGAVEAGKLAVKLLKDIAAPKIVMLRGLSGIDADIDRSEGFRQGIKGTPLENAVVAEKAADFERQKGYSVMADILQAQPKIDLVYAMNDEMAIGAYQAIKEAGRTGIKIIGYDGAKGCVEMIKNGEITATVAQKFATLGTSAVDYVVKAAEGKAKGVEKVIYIGTEMVTAENAANYEFK